MDFLLTLLPLTSGMRVKSKSIIIYRDNTIPRKESARLDQKMFWTLCRIKLDQISFLYYFPLSLLSLLPAWWKNRSMETVERFDFITNLSFGSHRFDIDIVFPFPLPGTVAFSFSLGLTGGKPSSRPCCLLLRNFWSLSAPFRTRSSMFDDQSRPGRCWLKKNLLESFFGY